MAAPVINMRVPPAILAQLDARAAEEGQTRTDVVMDAILAHLSGHQPEALPASRKAAPAAPKAERARTALVAAEARQGVRAAPRLDTSMVPVHDGSKRPAYQKRQAGQEKAGRGGRR